MRGVINKEADRGNSPARFVDLTTADCRPTTL